MKKRRDMKKTIGIQHIECTELCKTIRKRMTNEIRAHNTKMIQKTLEDNKSYKKTKQGLATGKSQIIALKGEDGNIISDRELVIKRVEEFYQDLFTSKFQITPPIIDVESAEDNIPPIGDDEVEKCLNDMKRGKAPGEDGVPVDILMDGGSAVKAELATLFTSLCIQTNQTSDSWNNALIIILIHMKGDIKDLKN
ncbi:uncharacterized protein [Amphiura filiformis]|uniref:uncharacterized protein n=1 Tax=Amphiura filiformis TaxID=82378 RepID=UPI003B223385